jgi:hypothetical protein
VKDEKRMNTTDKRLILPLFIIASIALCFIVLLLSKIQTPVCPPGKVCIDPLRVSCFAHDLSAHRWIPSSPEQRHFISAKVADKKAEYLFQSGGVDCYELDKHFVLGDRIMELPTEWYRAVSWK